MENAYGFQMSTLAATPNPQQLVYLGLRQCYSAKWMGALADGLPLPSKPEKLAGELVIKHLLKGGRGHFGPLEAPAITISCGYFPHSTMQQIRTHRVGVSVNCQSFRYTSESILGVAKGKRTVEDTFYLRPVGMYRDRQGGTYEYTDEMRKDDLFNALAASRRYADQISQGISEEHARGMIPFDVRQHWDITLNARSLMHVLDLRWKADAQLECQIWSEMVFEEFKKWMPEIAEWYETNRAKRARLAP